ncbi:M23 family metallopeptidase [Cronobacter sakazakii]
MVPDAQGVMVDAQRNTRAPGRVEMSQLSAVDPDGHSVTDKKRAAYYEIEPEAGWLAAEKAEKISRYALAALGFTTLKSTTENFDLIDGIHHPAGVVKGILEQLYAAAQAETRSSYALNAFNYRRLLEQVDSNRDGHYSEEEYVQAIHNPSYRNQLFRLIVKHPGEWYYSKGDAPWKNYLDSLGEDAQAWRDYTEAFLDKIVWMKQVPEMVAEPWHMHPVMFLGALKQRKEKIIIFPLKVKPENDPGHIWSRFDWRNKHRANMAAFGANRQGNRKHAARDLYTKPYEEVVAICDGVVLDTRVFYCQTNQVTIRHQTKDGRYFIVRYGELDPESICISINNNVCQGQVIGKTGKLMDSGHPVVVRDGRIVFMLHFEYYSGEEGLNLMHSLTETSRLPYQRRRDLEDPLSILDEGFKNTFHENYQNERLDIINLKTSANGKLFIKSWESLGLEAYNDANGFCTIGYGHLIEKKRCEDIIISAQFQSGITEENAETLFNEDLIKYEEAVK